MQWRLAQYQPWQQCATVVQILAGPGLWKPIPKGMLSWLRLEDSQLLLRMPVKLAIRQ